MEPITAFTASVEEAAKIKYQAVGAPFDTFFDEVYPAYLKAMTTKADYYLSDIELLALARCTGTNVAIFVHNLEQDTLTYVRSYVASPRQSVATTCVQTRGVRGAIRTHFERLSSEEESLARPTNLPAPKRPKTVEELGLCNEKKGASEKIQLPHLRLQAPGGGMPSGPPLSVCPRGKRA